jgi:hypothetical protein
MLRDAWRSLFGGGSAAVKRPRAIAAPRLPRPKIAAPHSRSSLGLAQFFSNLERSERLRVLDLSGASQANLNFVLQYGHHLYCENFMATLESVFGDGDDFFARQSDEDLVDQFLSQTFANLQGPFDGALVWDSLQFLQPPLLDHTVGHLHRLLEPGALLHAFFQSDDRAQWVPVNAYRIEAANSFHVIPRDLRPAPPPFNARALEKLFGDFTSVKFFLSRDHIRELIVTR